jgi:hypothetical protein
VFDETPTEGTFNTHVRDNFRALRQWDYAQLTTGIAITATTEATATTIITGNAVTYDGSIVMVEFYAPQVWFTDITGRLVLYQDGSSIGFIANCSAATGTSVLQAVHATRRLTPTAGSHTYSIRGFKSGGGTFTVTGDAGGAGLFVPAFLRITPLVY